MLRLTSRTPPRVWPTVLAVALVLGTIACDSSPTDPDGAPIVLTGELESRGLSSHPITLTESGIVTIELVELSVVETSIPLLDATVLGVGVGVGQQLEDECSLTARFALLKGQRLLFSLPIGDFCVGVFDNGGLPPDTVLGYTLEIEIDS